MNSLIAAGWHPIVIPDDAKRQITFGQRFRGVSKPYDLGALDTKGRYTAFELKSQDSPTWNFSELRESEHAGLQAVTDRGRPAFIVIRFSFRPGPRQAKVFGNDWVDQVIALPYDTLRELEAAGRQSLPLLDALPALSVAKAGKDLWDVSGF